MAQQLVNATTGFENPSWDPSNWYELSDYGTGLYYVADYSSNRILLQMPATSIDRTKVTTITVRINFSYSTNQDQWPEGVKLNFGFSTTKTFVSGTASAMSATPIKPSGGGDVVVDVTWTGIPTVSLTGVWYLSLSFVNWNTVQSYSFSGGFRAVYINYETYSACSIPTSFTITNSLPQYNMAVTFNWSGAAAGTGNPITAYKIFYDSANNGSYSTLLATISTSATSGSYSFTPNHSLNTTRYYKIQTIGTVAGYNSVLSTTYVSITVKPPRMSYYNGAWGEYEVYIHNGTTWQACQIFGYDTAWRECHT